MQCSGLESTHVAVSIYKNMAQGCWAVLANKQLGVLLDLVILDKVDLVGGCGRLQVMGNDGDGNIPSDFW